MSDRIEIQDASHIMKFEGTISEGQTEEGVERAVCERGFIATNIEIGFDDLQKLWRVSGDIEKI